MARRPALSNRQLGHAADFRPAARARRRGARRRGSSTGPSACGRRTARGASTPGHDGGDDRAARACRPVAGPAPAVVRLRPLHLRDAAPREPQSRPRVARRHGGRARLVRVALAEPGRRRGALYRVRGAHRDGALGDLPAPHLAHARVGGGAARPRPVDSRAARRARRRQQGGQPPLWAGRSVLARRAGAVATSAGPRAPPDRRRRRGVEPWLHRHALLAAPLSLVSAHPAALRRGRAAAARARATGLRERGPHGRGAGARAGRGRAAPAANPHAARGGNAQAHRVDDLLGVRRGARRRPARPRRAPRTRASPRHHSRHARRRAIGDGADRLHDSRGEPPGPDSPRVRLWRPRPMLHVPRPRRAGPHGDSRRERGRAPRAGARRRAAGRAARLPVAASGDVAVRPLVSPQAAPPSGAAAHRSLRGQRATSHRAVRRPPEIHGARRAAAPVRRCVLSQPLLRGGGARDRARGRRDEPVHGRRRHGAVRRGRRCGARMPGRPARRPGDRGERRRAERRHGRRARRAAAPRHRHPHGRRGRGADGLSRDGVPHGSRRHGPRGEPTPRSDEAIPGAARDLRGRCRPSRRRRLSIRAPRDHGEKPPRAAGDPSDPRARRPRASKTTKDSAGSEQKPSRVFERLAGLQLGADSENLGEARRGPSRPPPTVISSTRSACPRPASPPCRPGRA